MMTGQGDLVSRQLKRVTSEEQQRRAAAAEQQLQPLMPDKPKEVVVMIAI
jgi:hypothetical protein